MASPLLDAVKQGTAGMAAPGTPTAAPGLQPTGGTQTEQLAGLTATAQTGKAVQPQQGGTSRLSALGEKLANVQTLMGAQAIQQQGILQNTAQAQQEQIQQQQYVAQATQVSQQRLDAQQTFNNKIKGMFQDQNNSLANLHMQDDKSRAEQMGVMLRLGSERYVTQLSDAASKARLDSSANFQAALTASVFSDETALMSTSLQFRNYAAADARAATAQLANMDLDYALQVAQTENKAASGQAMWSGVGSLTSAGALAFAAGSGGTTADASGTEGNFVMQDAGNGPAQDTGQGSYNPTEGIPSTPDLGGAYTPPGQ